MLLFYYNVSLGGVYTGVNERRSLGMSGGLDVYIFFYVTVKDDSNIGGGRH